MDRSQAIAALQALGVDTSLITDAVPDPLLQSLLQACQKAGAPPAPGGQMADDTSDPKQIDAQQRLSASDVGQTDQYGNMPPQFAADCAGMPNKQTMAAGVTSPDTVTSAAAITPASITLKFADGRTGTVQGIDLTNLLAPIHRTMAQLQTQQQSLNRQQSDKLAKLKNEKIAKFLDEMSSPTCLQLTPAMIPSVRNLLQCCDDNSVRKFSASAQTGSELDERMSEIRTTYPKQRAGNGPKVTQPSPNEPATSANHSAGNGKPSPRAMDILKQFPAGRAAIERVNKAK